MRMMSIASGSSGNCTYIGDGDTVILVDTGISLKKIEEGLNKAGHTGKDIDGVLITHEHNDHIKGLGVLLRKYDIPVFATEGTIQGIKECRNMGKYDSSLFREIGSNDIFSVGNLEIRVHPISHDAREPVCYSFHEGSRKAVIATDMGCYDDDLRQFLMNSDAMLIESNHDVHMLEVGPYPYDLKRRDYTINAMLMDRYGNVIDEYNGRCDMENHIVRMIGDPYERYDEDALRILRGIYLVAKLDYELSDDTFEAMTSKAPLLEYVSDGRKRKELDKIIKFNSNNSALKVMVNTNVFRFLKGLDRGIVYMLSNKIVLNDPFMFYALAFKINGTIIKTYEFDRLFSKRLENVIKASENDITLVDMLDCDIDILKEANELKKMAGEKYISNIEEVYNSLPIHSIKEINANKDEIKEIYGNEINELLKDIASKILEDKLNNSNDEIIRYVEKVKK